METKKQEDFLKTVKDLKNNVFITNEKRQQIIPQENNYIFNKKQDNNVLITVETPAKKIMSGKDNIYSFLDDIFYYHPEKRKEDYDSLQEIYYKIMNTSDERKEKIIVQLYNSLIYFNIKISFLTKTLVSTSYEIFIGIFIRLLLISCKLGGGFLSFMGSQSLNILLSTAGITDPYIKTLINIIIGICAYSSDNKNLLAQTNIYGNIKETINPGSLYYTNVTNKLPENTTKESFSSNKTDILDNILKMRKNTENDSNQF